MYIAAALLASKRMPAHPIFPFNIIENFTTSFALDSVFICSKDFRFCTETRHMVLQATPKFGEIAHNLHKTCFDEVI